MSAQPSAPLSALGMVGLCLVLGIFGLGLFYAAFVPSVVCPDRPAVECYFPAQAMPDGDARGASRRAWYARHLAAMEEPSLFARQPEERALRFLWVRTFHHPIAIRISDSSGAVRLTAVELDGAGGWGPGKMLRRIDRVLTEQEIQQYHQLVSVSGIWSVPVEPETEGRDGAHWVFEIANGDRYRLVERWSPNADPMRTLGIGLLGLAGWEVRQNDLY